MAMSDQHQQGKKKSSVFPLVSLLCFASIFLALSLSRRASLSSQPFKPTLQLNPNNNLNTPTTSCDYTNGTWVYDPQRSPKYDNTCKEIFKGWNCVSNNKSNAWKLTKWRWQPHACDLPELDPLNFLENFRDTNIGFVGDSLNRNMFVSLFCTLRTVSSEVKKWRPAKADRGFTFLKYNLTIAYHRTNLLARYGRWSANTGGGPLETLGYKEGYRVDVDIPDPTWVDAPSFHNILIFNTGHWWWAPSKFDPIKSPMLFFEKGVPVVPPVPPEAGLDLVLKNMISLAERKTRSGAIKFLRTQSPRHFEGGDWDQGGSCRRLRPLSLMEAENLFSVTRNGTNVEARMVNEHLYKTLSGSDFYILDISRMSEVRADAHPSTSGGKKHEDCMHWCLPGLTDTWNDLFTAKLSDIKFRN